MRYYAAWGHTEFVLCLGYKGDVIREYFLGYNEALFNDFVLEGHGADAAVEFLNRDVGHWRITFVDTGMQSTIGERLKARRAVPGGRRGLLRHVRRRSDGRAHPGPVRTLRGSGGGCSSSRSCGPHYNAHIVEADPDGTVSRITA